MTATTCYCELADRGILRLDGAEAASFLQGLVSNDVEQLSPARSLYAALLTPQGKYLFDFILFRQGSAILLDAERERLAELHKRLLLYRLRTKVEIEDVSAGLAIVAAWGENALARLDLPAEPGATRPLPDGAGTVDPRLAALGARVVLSRDRIAAFAAERGLEPATAQDYERHRLTQGIPAGSRDLVVQKALLLESNFEELHGVSFTKGCFVGQELTARTKHRALIRKRLLPVRIDGPAPPPGTPVMRGARDAGELRSHADGRGLALLRLELLAGAEPLTAADAELEPEIPPWLEPSLA